MRHSYKRDLGFLLLKVAVFFVFGAGGTFAAQPQVAMLTAPANGATNVASSCTFQWTAVAAAQAYYLWVGTSPGAKDVVNSGSFPASSTSCIANNLPFGQTLYATIWTELAGVWWLSQSSFTTVPQIAVLTSPADGATKVASPCTFQWTGVAGAQAYYLWVGTSPGAKDVVHTSGGLPASSTSYTAKSLPHGLTLYATIWTELAGVWRPSQSSFTTAPQIATLASPANGATRVASSCTFQWTGVAAAQAYYLWVGTSAGAKDVVNTGSLPASGTSYMAKSLPFGQVLYATIWTELAGVWWSSQSSFTTVPQIAVLTSPADGATKGASPCTFQWTGVPAAQAYYLWVGTTPGAKDVVHTSGGLPAGSTSYTAKNLPYSQTLYATIWTELAGHWYSSSSTFKTGPKIAVLTTPADGATDVDPDLLFQWTSITGAQGYYLYVGTSPGAKDIVNTGALPNTYNSLPGIGIPFGKTLYVTILTELDGVWWPGSSTFTTMAVPPPSTTPNGASSMVFPVDGAMNIDIGQPFQWTYSGYSGTYWLVIGTTHGGCDVSNSGPIHVPRQFVSNLPLGTPLFGQLFVKAGDIWSLAHDFTFSARSNATTTDTCIQSAFWATDYVRQMANDKNTTFAGTLLNDYAFRQRYYPHANCGVYAQTLLEVLDEMTLPLDARILRVVFDTNVVACDGHVLVEVFNPSQQSWMLLDPCFDLTAKRTSDGEWATAEDISTATRNQTWNQIEYVFLGSKGDKYARNYYIDYPLLYLNVYHDGTPIVPSQGLSILPYFSQVSLPEAGYGEFAIRSPAQYSVTYVDTVNGNKLCTVDCDGVDSFSHVFIAWSVAVPDGESGFELYRPNRYVF